MSPFSQFNSPNSNMQMMSNAQLGSSLSPYINQSNAQNEIGKQTAIFKEFIKYVYKRSRNNQNQGNKKMPNLRDILGCREYKDYDIRKSLSIEILEWIIPLGNSDDKGCKMLLFIIPKNQTERRAQDLQSFEKQKTAVVNEDPTGSKSLVQQETQDPELSKQSGAFEEGGNMPLKTLKTYKAGGNMETGILKHKTIHKEGSKGLLKKNTEVLSSKTTELIQRLRTGAQQPISQNFLQSRTFRAPGVGGLSSSKPVEKKPEPAIKPSISFDGSKGFDKQTSQIKGQKSIADDKQPSHRKKSPEKQKDEIGPQKQKTGMVITSLNLKQVDIELQKFERQETDDNDEDDQEQLDTERIDVKRDIALNDEMKVVNESQTSSSIKHQSIGSVPDTVNQMQGSIIQNKFLEIAGGKPGGEPKSAQSLRPKPPLPEYINQSVVGDDQDFDDGDFKSDQNIIPTGSQSKYQSGYNLSQQAKMAADQDENEDEENDMYSDRKGLFDDDGEGYDDDDEYADDDEMQEDEGNELEEDYNQAEEAENQRLISEGDAGFEEDEEGLLLPSDPRSPASLYSQDASLRKNRYENNQRGRSKKRQKQQLQEQQAQWEQMQQQAILNAQAKLQTIKKFDYSRIVTNPKYKYFDEETCGSAYFNDCNASEKEIDVRENFKRHQASRLQKTNGIGQSGHHQSSSRHRLRGAISKRRIVDADKVQGAGSANDEGGEVPGEQSTEGTGKSKRNRKSRRKTGQEDKEGESKSQSEEGDSYYDDENNIDGQGEEGPLMDETAEDVQEQTTNGASQHNYRGGGNQDQGAGGNASNDEGEVSSVASSTQSQARTFYSLKEAIDEKFVPRQIRNLNQVANIVWIAVLLLSVIYFVIQLTLFSKIQSYIEIIVNSEKRIDDIMTINLKLTDIALINEGVLQVNSSMFNSSSPKDQAIQKYTQSFIASSTSLMDLQTRLSQDTSQLADQSRIRINPMSVTLQYFDSKLQSSYVFNIWEAIVQIHVFAFSLAETPSLINHTNPQMRFIQVNCMNSILVALKESTQAIVDESESTRRGNNDIFLILLVSVSGALLLSMVFLLPVIRRAKNNRQEVFELFTHKKVEKQVDEQLKRCRWFIQKYQQQNENQNDYDDGMDNHMNIHAAAIEENAHMPGEKELKGSNGDGQRDDYISKVKKQKKKWKPLDNNFFSIIIRFFVVLLLIESYFVYSYLYSESFLETVGSLTQELRVLISRQPQLTYLMLMEKELLYTNGTQQYLYRPVREVLKESFLSQNQDYQTLIDLFHSNYNNHGDQYNADFEKIMNSDLCAELSSTTEEGQDVMTTDECRKSFGQQLSKGIQDTVVNYWLKLDQIQNDFFGSQRTQNNSKTLLNTYELQRQQIILESILQKKHWYLVDGLKTDIDASFTNKDASNQTVFSIFVLYIVFIYLVVWRLFMKGVVEELWRAKMCLSVLPVEICFRIEEIRSFIYRNSSGFGAGAGSAS